MARRSKRGHGPIHKDQPAARGTPAVSTLAQSLLAEAERENRMAERQKSRDDGPKPRAIRRYERYANMGD